LFSVLHQCSNEWDIIITTYHIYLRSMNKFVFEVFEAENWMAIITIFMVYLQTALTQVLFYMVTECYVLYIVLMLIWTWGLLEIYIHICKGLESNNIVIACRLLKTCFKHQTVPVTCTWCNISDYLNHH